MTRTNPYIGKTGRGVRPVPPADGKCGATGRADVPRDQAAGDAAAEWDRDNKRLHAERIAALEAEHAAGSDVRRREAASAVLDELRTRYLGADPAATDADFDRDLPAIQRQRRIAAALAEPSRVGPSAGRRA